MSVSRFLFLRFIKNIYDFAPIKDCRLPVGVNCPDIRRDISGHLKPHYSFASKTILFLEAVALEQGTSAYRFQAHPG